MKKVVSILLILQMGLILNAQEATTTWPYLYPSFREGTVRLQGGKVRSQQLNIHLRHDALHYLDPEGRVMQAFLVEVVGAEIGEDAFLNVGGEMMKVVARSGKGCVVAEILGDYAALAETGGAYGSSSSTSATRKLSSVETDAQINQPHMLLMQEKENGQALGILTKYYLVWPGGQVQASRREVEKSLSPERKAAWKAWQKSHKIKWNKVESIAEVLDFLND